MTYQDRTEKTASRRRGSVSSRTYTYRGNRRREIRFDLIVMGLVAVVLVFAMNIPYQPSQPTVPVYNDPETGKPENQMTVSPATEDPLLTEPAPTQPAKPLTFTAEDEPLIYVRTISWTDGDADTDDVIAALEAPLDWNLTDSQVTVLIIHSHISESFTLTEDQIPDESYGFLYDDYRTDDSRYNMIAVGERVAQVLREHGIQVIHDTTSFEVPNSNYSYANARTHLQELLEETSGICLILDLHRDSAPDPNDGEKQWAPTVTVDGKETAMISMLAGYNDVYDQIWYDNLSFAVKLGAQLNHNTPDIFRQLLINNADHRYNQDLGPVTMLIEVGTAGNTLEQTLNAAQLLGEALAELALGANLE